MKHLASAHELLNEVAELLLGIEAAYAEAKSTQPIVVVARPKVKACLEHLRSVLEYIASALAETLPARPKRSYFPYGTDPKLYAESLARNLPGLDEKFKPLLESVQPFACGDLWLIHLASATNFNKHVSLQEQERKNLDPQSLRMGNLLVMDGGGTIGKLIVDGQLVNPKGPMTVHTEAGDLNAPPGLPVTKVYGDVKFILKGPDVDLLELLKTSRRQIEQFVLEVEKL